METKIVRISDMKIADMQDGLITYALGSCIGIAIYDKIKKIGALCHIMLPGDTDNLPKDQTFKFATTSIPETVRQLEKRGCSRINMVAKIAGGASLVQFTGGSNLGNIGERNTASVKKTLRELNIKIIGEDTGKDYARTMLFTVGDGVVKITTYGNGIYYI